MLPLYEAWIKFFEHSGNGFNSFLKIHRSIRIKFRFVGRWANYTDCTFHFIYFKHTRQQSWAEYSRQFQPQYFRHFIEVLLLRSETEAKMSWNCLNCYSSTIKTAWYHWIYPIDCVMCVSSPHFVSMNCSFPAIMHVHVGVSIHTIYNLWHYS